MWAVYKYLAEIINNSHRLLRSRTQRSLTSLLKYDLDRFIENAEKLRLFKVLGLMSKDARAIVNDVRIELD